MKIEGPMIGEGGAVPGAQTVERALQMLDVLASSRGGLRLSDLSHEMRLNISTTSRVLGALDRFGYVQRDPDTGRYRLGYRLLQLSQIVLEQSPLPEMANPVLAQLMEETGETATLCIRHDDHAIVIARVECANPLRSVAQIGHAGPLYCTGHGKVMLAHMPEEETERILAVGMPGLTPLTITDPGRMAEELGRVRAQGYAVDNGERDPELVSVVGPVWDAAGRVAATCGVSGSSQRIRAELVPALAATVMAAAATLSSRLGGRPPENNKGC
jgi:DNA-binding IclR family transcriptional regulator